MYCRPPTQEKLHNFDRSSTHSLHTARRCTALHGAALRCAAAGTHVSDADCFFSSPSYSHSRLDQAHPTTQHPLSPPSTHCPTRLSRGPRLAVLTGRKHDSKNPLDQQVTRRILSLTWGVGCGEAHFLATDHLGCLQCLQCLQNRSGTRSPCQTRPLAAQHPTVSLGAVR